MTPLSENIKIRPRQSWRGALHPNGSYLNMFCRLGRLVLLCSVACVLMTSFGERCQAAEPALDSELDSIVGLGRCSYVSAGTGSACDPNVTDNPCEFSEYNPNSSSTCDPYGHRCVHEDGNATKITSGPAPKHDECKPNRDPAVCCNLVQGYCVRFDMMTCVTMLASSEPQPGCPQMLERWDCEEIPTRSSQQSGLRNVAQAGCP